MVLLKLGLISLMFGLIMTCNGNLKNEFKIDVPKSGRLSWGDSLEVNVKPKSLEFDSIIYELAGKKIEATHLLEDEPLGEQILIATAYIDGKNYIADKKLRIFSNKSPELFSYELLNTFPHDKDAYTQGLEFDGDILYESTGLRGESSLRKIDYKTGEIQEIISLDKSYFGEGITIIDDKILQLTWTSDIGFVYDKESLEVIKSFDYQESKEGWGLCSDGERIYKSDGTNQIWILNNQTYEEVGRIQAMTNKSTIDKLNELEYVDGYIYANTYQQDREVIVIIDSKSGVVRGVVDLVGLKDLVDQDANPDVLNGIAFNEQTKTFFVTGKRWDKLFEIRIVRK